MKARIELILVLCVYLMGEADSTVYESGDVPRVNYGAYFRMIHEAPVVSGRWTHTFSVKVPSDVFASSRHDIVMGERVEGKRRKWFDQCLEKIHDGVDEPTGENYGAHNVSEVPGFGTVCSRFYPIISRMIKTVKEEHFFLKGQVNAITALLPPDFTLDVSNNATRIGRGLFDAVGSVSKWLFGTSLESDNKKIEANM